MSDFSNVKNILICSYAFWPSLGGLELTSEKLAFWLVDQGYDVTVVTFTNLFEAEERDDFTFKIVRSPNKMLLWKLFQENDLVISKHLSLNCVWPALVQCKPFLIWHATWYPDDENILNSLLRKMLVRKSINVANSEAISSDLEKVDAIIHPGYAEKVYKNYNQDSQRSGFAFLGRLSHEKGCDLLIHAMSRFKKEQLLIIGDGNKRQELERQVVESDLSSTVKFVGRLNPQQCNQILNSVRVLVVPSLYDEPFGTVALEGLAAGCRVVVSTGGGLSEAAGPTGFVFESGNLESLCKSMQEALDRPISLEETQFREQHLQQNSFDVIAPKLMALFKDRL